jgi:NAD(P)-dependent dehydrogenase (short-subunit alcohol dehydrogenase family)
MFDMEGKTILYTGGAGGLGLETTMHFLDAGARVIVIDRDQAKMAALAEAAKTHHAERLLVVDFDLSDLSGLRAKLAEIQASFGQFNVVINNAAIYPAKPFEEFTVEEHQAVQRVNVDAGIVCVQAALPHMKNNNWGRIINIASVTFYGGWALLAPYVQSKGALIGLARAWARELGPFGITANAVSPGAFPTDAEKIHPDPEGYTKHVLDHQAVKFRGSPADIANALMFLASDGARFITGQTLNVDGGWVMH